MCVCLFVDFFSLFGNKLRGILDLNLLTAKKNRTRVVISDMAPTNDPADFSKLRSVEPINTDPDAPPPTLWERMKNNIAMLLEVSRTKPIGETLCIREAFIFGRSNSLIVVSSPSLFLD